MRGQRIIYTADQMAWLEANRAMIISDYHRAFTEAFGRQDVSVLNLHALRKRKGWFVGRGKGRFAGRHRKYSATELAWLEANRHLPISDYHAGFQAAFDRPDVEAPHLHAMRKRMGWKTGRTGQFSPGQAPANKGKPCPEGVGGRSAGARRTQFRKGQEPHNTKHLGHERMTIDGYVEISVAETNPHTGYGRRYVLKHVHLWEAANGPVPEGHCLKSIDGDRSNTDPANWQLIPRAILPRLNGGRSKKHLAYNDASPEIRPMLVAIAKVAHTARQKVKA